MYEPLSLAVIADLIDRVGGSTSLPGTRRRRHVVATLDVLAEDLVGRHSLEAIRLKHTIRTLVDSLCPGREMT